MDHRYLIIEYRLSPIKSNLLDQQKLSGENEKNPFLGDYEKHFNDFQMRIEGYCGPQTSNVIYRLFLY